MQSTAARPGLVAIAAVLSALIVLLHPPPVSPFSPPSDNLLPSSRLRNRGGRGAATTEERLLRRSSRAASPRRRRRLADGGTTTTEGPAATSLLLGGDDYGGGVEGGGMPPPSSRIEDCKRELIRRCDDRGGDGGGGRSPTVEDSIRELERLGEDLGFGQASSTSGLINGVWELVYSPDDVTRSSPFFWAFRRAFPDSSDQIFGITDAIPPPLKIVGPATQTVDVDSSSGTNAVATGTLVSRVKVATLGGVATSIMTTRCAVLGSEGIDGLRMRVTSTKPEDSTILSKLGPLGEFVSSSSPPFPSGDALDRVAPGSSEVVMRTTYCDEGLRVSRNADRPEEDVFVWKRVKFGSGNTVSL